MKPIDKLKSLNSQHYFLYLIWKPHIINCTQTSASSSSNKQNIGNKEIVKNTCKIFFKRFRIEVTNTSEILLKKFSYV